MPSLAVNKNGDFVIGFSGSSANDYVGAYYAGRRNGGTPAQPIRYLTGKDWCRDYVDPVTHLSYPMRWGDYSHTTLDPDALTIWTIQEYAETRFHDPFWNAFGTRIGAITPF